MENKQFKDVPELISEMSDKEHIAYVIRQKNKMIEELAEKIMVLKERIKELEGGLKDVLSNMQTPISVFVNNKFICVSETGSDGVNVEHKNGGA